MKISTRRTWAEINLNALKKNIETLRCVSGSKEIIAVVKANAYGHGVKIVAPALWEEGVRYFAVSNINEALEIAALLPFPDVKIIIFGYAEVIAEHDFIYTVGSVEYGKRLNAHAAEMSRKIRVHIKVDTGMGRVGIDSDDELSALLSLPGLNVEAVYTHFAVSDSEFDDALKYTAAQQEKLLKMLKIAPDIPFHSQNSGGILYHNDFKGEFVRAGIAMYGYHPNPDLKETPHLYPVMTLKSVVWQVKELQKGAFISYGKTFKCPDIMRVAVIPIGYADGYSRALSNVGCVLIRGMKAPVLGRVCMDQIIVDVSEIKNVAPGDEVLVYSPQSPFTDVNQIAKTLKTISYEVLCNVSARVERICVNS